MSGCIFAGSCIHLNGDDITEMVDNEIEEIEYESFIKYVPEKELAECFSNYAWNGASGLTLKEDCHVRYHRSFFKGEPCVYVVHSGIEYVYLV